MAGTGSAVYNGVFLPTPNTYGFVNPSGLSFPGNSNLPVVYLIGNAVGGEPGTVLGPYYTYGSVQQACQSGDLVDAARFAFKAGAGAVCLWRPYTATQSSLTLLDGSSNPSITLTSADYGNWTNALLASISGSAGSLVATLKDNYHNTTLTSTALGGVISLQYTGNGTTATVTTVKAQPAVTVSYASTATTGGTIPASATVYVRVVPRNASGQGAPSTEVNHAVGSGTSTNTITFSWTAQSSSSSYDVYVSTSTGTELYYGNVAGAASGTLQVVITSIPSGTAPCPTAATDGPDLVTWVSGQTDGSLNQDLNLASPALSTVQGLASYLSGQIGYSAVVQTNAGTVSSTLIDSVSAQNIKTAYVLTSNVGMVVNWFNGTGLVTAVAATNANPPAAVGLTPFAGGSDGTTQTSNWTAAAAQIGVFSPLLRYVVPLTSTVANMQTVAQAITSASVPPGASLCEGFYGGAIGETQTVAQTNAATLNSQRAVYVGMADFYDYNTSYVKTHFPGYMMAAYYAGLRAGLPPQMPLTNKTINVLQLGQVLSATVISQLNQAGVSVPQVGPTGRISVSLATTTDTSGSDYNNLYYVEESVTNSVDTLIMWLVQRMNNVFKGQPNYGNTTAQLMLAEVNASLTVARDTYQWIAGFIQANTVTQLVSNPTYNVIPLTIKVVEPINGIILVLSLQLPLSTISTL